MVKKKLNVLKNILQFPFQTYLLVKIVFIVFLWLSPETETLINQNLISNYVYMYFNICKVFLCIHPR